VDFREVDRRYIDLKRQYDNGDLSAEEFDAQLEQMMVQDDEGRWWAKSRQTGIWHYYDGSTWVRGTPPDYETSTIRGRPPEQDPPPVQPPYQEPPRGGVRPPGAEVPGYLLPASIAATLLCCLPTGIAAIVYSAQANSKSQAGDTAGASQAVKNANIWLMVSVVGGLVIAFLVLVGSSGNP
jgi:hypothetical protein